MHFMRLCEKGRKEDGWTDVSEVVWPLISEVPNDLMDREKLETGGRCKLTEEGEILLRWS